MLARCLMGTSLLCLAIVLADAPGQPPPPAQPPAPPDGVDILAHGPIHEAYAQPVSGQPKPGVVIAKKPPDPVEEVPPDQKPAGDNVQWIPGYWAYDDDAKNYMWVSGFWRVPPPGRRWVPGHWQEVEGGWMWVSGFWTPEAQAVQVNYLPPPPPTLDQGPTTPAPDAASTYIPGCWVYVDARYRWRPGHWIAFQPNWVWIAAHYVWTPGGCIFIDGYWDHPLDQCGLLFAPVRFGPRWFALRRPFIPEFVVKVDFLLGAMFVGPLARHYYFGDYFEPKFAQRGFVTWIDYHGTRGVYDPYFAYFRHQHAAEPHWEAGLRELYRARAAGEVARPPRTLVQQREVINKLAVNKTENAIVHKNVNITNVQNVTALTTLKDVHNTRLTNLGSLSKVPESKIAHQEVKLQPIAKEEHAREVQAAAQLHAVGQQRRDAEAGLIRQGGVPIAHTDAPKQVKLDLPKPVNAPRPPVKTPPPKPAIPNHEEREIPKYEPHRPPGPPKK